MSDSLRDRIAAAIADHCFNEWGVTDADMCACGECPPGDWDAMGSGWPAHVADAVIAELGLRREENEADFTGPYRHRYVTDWKADDE